MLPGWKQTLRAIHEDEEGLEALQVVMIIAIAAVILALLKIMWPTISKWVKGEVDNVVGKENFKPVND